MPPKSPSKSPSPPRAKKEKAPMPPRICLEDGPARTGDMEGVKAWIKRRWESLEEVDPEGMTAVHQATLGGHVDIIKELCRFKADPSAREGRGLTAVHLAADAGQVAVLQCLSQVPGVDLLETDLDGCSAVQRAARRGQVEVLDWLQDQGVDLLAPGGNGKTAMHYAAMAGHHNVLRFLPPSGTAKLLERTSDLVKNGRPKTPPPSVFGTSIFAPKVVLEKTWHYTAEAAAEQSQSGGA
eukprot:TRINITY_DN81462_c0_g1_i1.p1 TRINITY_DN81462_c0_g1~~TRINITY_DN81462_c0_g1_i1.p1  ORF type:complete len:239 (-),score=58.35 TRINITY_DN81462_c0_g1_i1:51-767(-)